MAETQHQQVSAFPLPPMEFINQYTPENVHSGRAPKPPMPPKGKYFMFGEEFENNDVIIRSLESQGIRRLYPLNFDHKRELKKLNHSILVSYLDLLDILVKCPSGSNSKSPSPGSDAPTLRKDKLDDLNLLFIHIHHLINEYRPHQARETLRVILEKQKKERLEIANRLEHYLDRVMAMLKTNVETLGSDSPMSWNDAEDAEQKHAIVESTQPAPDEDELIDNVLLKMIENEEE